MTDTGGNIYSILSADTVVSTTNSACVSGGASTGSSWHLWPYPQYSYPTKSADLYIRFIENGVLVEYAGKEYAFKDLEAAAKHITKLRE